MTLISATACFLLLLITTTHGLSLDTHYDHASNPWNHHSVEEPFLTLWNLSLKTCVERCQIRKACRAVNYCRTRRSCQLLETDSGEFASQNVTEEFNVFVRMSDVRLTPQLAEAFSACNCTINQTCLLNTPSCVVTECRRLNVANAVILGNMARVGARVKVVCNNLYKLYPPSQDQSVCQTDGQWLPAITCAPYTVCGPPRTVDAATFVAFTNVSNVVSAVYECDVGYGTPGDFSVMSVECLNNSATWGTIGFECLAVCDAPPNVTLATVSAGENLHGFTKVYTCDAGYAVNGSANITCQADATWSLIQFVCIAECGVPPAVPNGMALDGDTFEESVRNYTCDTGYAPNSISTLVTCQMDGNWTAVEFECIIDCGVPPAITNAEVSSGGTSEGDTRTYTCTAGYVLRNNGTADITCQSNGTWSTASFNCLWDCGPPPTIPNATVYILDTVVSSNVTYSCNEGYVANDTASTTTTICQAGATWSDIAFYCIADCGTPDAIPNTVISSAGGTTEGSVQTFACAANYAAQNIVTMDTTCLANGTWSTPMFECVPDCGEPTAITNAEVSTGGTLEGNTRSYTCYTGHVLHNLVTADITCQSDSSWSKASFVCLWDCGPAPNVANAWASTGETLENTVCGYTCNAGYAAIGNTTITCQAGNTWTAVSFSCVVDCKTPPINANAFPSSGGTTEGSIRTYMCVPGYRSNTSTTSITCQSSGTWTSAMFSCLKDCATPPSFPNAHITGSGTLVGDTRPYTCASGYVFSNVTTVDTTCQSDGMWSKPSFNCLWDCKNPAPIPFGTPSSGDTVTGSTRTYTCDYGYGATGSATITCEDGTGWSTPYPNCTELVCDTDWRKIGESCYYTPGNGDNYGRDVFAAEDFCHTYNAYLVQLETEAESNAVWSWYSELSSFTEAWIGMSDVRVEGTWVWMNTSVTATWMDWGSDEPDNYSGHDYCSLKTGGYWSDRRSSETLQPLCENSAHLP